MDAQGHETGVLCSEWEGWIVTLAIQKFADDEANWRLVPWFTFGNSAGKEDEQSLRALVDPNFGVPVTRPSV